MSWLRNHIRHYVVPTLKALARAERDYQESLRKNGLNRDIFSSFFDNYPGTISQRRTHNLLEEKREPINMRPARDCKTKELGMVLAACKCFGIDLKYHQEKMIRNMDVSMILPSKAYDMPNKEVSPQEQIHSLVKRSLRSLKRILQKDKRRRLILPGRDVWMWNVLAHKMSIPHVFDARISRGVARDDAVLKSIVDTWQLDEHTIIFDTGFAGSIYQRICGVSGIKCINLMLSTSRKDRKGASEQLYPNHKGSRAKALSIEYLPKYQKTGTIQGNKAVQYVADIDEFLQATVLTIWFWHHRSPKWVAQGTERCKVVDCLCRSCLLWKGGKVTNAML